MAFSPASAACTLSMLCGLLSPVPALAQAPQASERVPPPFAAWMLFGMDANIHGRVRGVLRIGNLSDIDSRVALVESTFVARPAVHLIAGIVYIAPASPSITPITLTRTGATWLPLRRRFTIENRLLLERRATSGSSFLRGRNRLRVSGSRPVGLPLAAYTSLETIGGTNGIAENRLQLGATAIVGRLSVESYWLQRRLPARTVINGVGLTTSLRMGK